MTGSGRGGGWGALSLLLILRQPLGVVCPPSCNSQPPAADLPSHGAAAASAAGCSEVSDKISHLACEEEDGGDEDARHGGKYLHDGDATAYSPCRRPQNPSQQPTHLVDALGEAVGCVGGLSQAPHGGALLPRRGSGRSAAGGGPSVTTQSREWGRGSSGGKE